MLYRAKENGDLGVKGCKVVGNGDIYGYELTETFFVDNSGFGDRGEPALVFADFLSKVKAGYYYGIREAGQFQVYIGEYKKIAGKDLKKIKEANGILSSKKVANNTRLTEYINGDKVLRLHNTDIIKWQAGRIVLNSGGWKTITTKSRFNQFLGDSGFKVYQEKNVWWILTPLMTKIKFFDGIEL
jgi:hypothetical protein